MNNEIESTPKHIESANVFLSEIGNYNVPEQNEMLNHILFVIRDERYKLTDEYAHKFDISKESIASFNSTISNFYVSEKVNANR